jgi:predicted dehydrogenase
MKKPVKVAIAGCGSRGRIYASYSMAHPEEMKVVGIAEPDKACREMMVRQYNIVTENTFKNWQEMANYPKFADAVIIATQDNMHANATAAFAEKGYDILLEKPMAITEQECRNIVDIVVSNRIIFAVCHVLRYTEYTRQLKEMIHNDLIGILSVFSTLSQ